MISLRYDTYVLVVGCKENHFYGKLKLAFTSPDVISTSPSKFFD